MASTITKSNWITPKEQLTSLIETSPQSNKMTAILKPIFAQLGIAGDVAGVVAGYTVNIEEMDPIATTWYTALDKLDAMPAKIPPLPSRIFQIFDRPCPFTASKRVGDTHTLMLIPDFVNLKGFEAHLQAIKTKGWDCSSTISHNFNPLSEPTHWVLMSKTILPGSERLSNSAQMQQIDALSTKASTQEALGKNLSNQEKAKVMAAAYIEPSIRYHVPTLMEATVAANLYPIGTGETLFPLKHGSFFSTVITCTNTKENQKVGGFYRGKLNGPIWTANPGIAPLLRLTD